MEAFIYWSEGLYRDVTFISHFASGSGFYYIGKDMKCKLGFVEC